MRAIGSSAGDGSDFCKGKYAVPWNTLSADGEGGKAEFYIA